MKELLSLIKARRSIRKFTNRTVPLDLILKAIEVARWAPSAHNAQPWRFIIITNSEIKEKLAKAMAKEWERDLAKNGVPKWKIKELMSESLVRFTRAPILILVCMTMEDMHKYPDEKRQKAEYIMAVQSVAAAIQNLLLAITALGLGACWYCAPLFCPDVVRGVLNIPEDIEPQALLAVGYPAEKPRPPPRKPLREIVYLEKWGNELDITD